MRSHINRRNRLNCLAQCLATALGLTSFVPACLCATVNVSRCDDPDRVQHNGYSLRQAIGHANDGDTVDLATVPSSCSVISLQLGEIPVNVDSLAIFGPADRTLVVDAGNKSRIFHHYGTGTLDIRYLTIANGTTMEDGGCITAPQGTVAVQHSVVETCYAHVRGGAIFTGGNALASHSSILYGRTKANSGGGIYAKGQLQVKYSAVFFNKSGGEGGGVAAAQAASIYHSSISSNFSAYGCAGLVADGNTTITSSEFSGNHTFRNGGAVCAFSLKPYKMIIDRTTLADNVADDRGGGLSIEGEETFITNSTISGNAAADGAGIAMSDHEGGVPGHPPGSVTILSSTIAFNSAVDKGGGIFASKNYAEEYCVLHMNSVILARNSSSSGWADLNNEQCDIDQTSIGVVVQQSNFIPSSWIRADPLLAPLAYHGGFARTHALLPGSPAIDHGYPPDGVTTDERGAGYPRVVGPSSDIGAYERQPDDDELFYAGFD